MGDRLMHVQSQVASAAIARLADVTSNVRLYQINGYDLQFVEHKHAVESIRRACDEGPTITLLVGHPTDYGIMPAKPIQATNGHRTPLHHDDQGDMLSYVSMKHDATAGFDLRCIFIIGNVEWFFVAANTDSVSISSVVMARKVNFEERSLLACSFGR